MGKPRESTNPENRITMREGIQSEISEATTSRSCFSRSLLRGNDLRANLRLWSYTNSHSRSLTLTATQLQRRQPRPNYVTTTHNTSRFSSCYDCPKYLYTSTSFWLFTSIAHEGKFRLFTSIVFHVGYLYDFWFRSRPSSSSTQLHASIRRDLFPNM